MKMGDEDRKIVFITTPKIYRKIIESITIVNKGRYKDDFFSFFHF
jgi:hypothetical protein